MWREENTEAGVQITLTVCGLFLENSISSGAISICHVLCKLNRAQLNNYYLNKTKLGLVRLYLGLDRLQLGPN